MSVHQRKSSDSKQRALEAKARVQDIEDAHRKMLADEGIDFDALAHTPTISFDESLKGTMQSMRRPTRGDGKGLVYHPPPWQNDVKADYIDKDPYEYLHTEGVKAVLKDQPYSNSDYLENGIVTNDRDMIEAHHTTWSGRIEFDGVGSGSPARGSFFLSPPSGSSPGSAGGTGGQPGRKMSARAQRLQGGAGDGGSVRSARIKVLAELKDSLGSEEIEISLPRGARFTDVKVIVASAMKLCFATEALQIYQGDKLLSVQNTLGLSAAGLHEGDRIQVAVRASQTPPTIWIP